MIGTKDQKHYLLVLDQSELELINYHEIAVDYEIQPNAITICTSSDKYIYKEATVYQRYQVCKQYNQGPFYIIDEYTINYTIRNTRIRLSSQKFIVLHNLIQQEHSLIPCINSNNQIVGTQFMISNIQIIMKNPICVEGQFNFNNGIVYSRFNLFQDTNLEPQYLLCEAYLNYRLKNLNVYERI